MARHYELNWYGEVLVHLDWAGEYTLCGLALEGDCEVNKNSPAIETSKKINCKNCIAIINFCKSIKKTEITKEQK